MWVTWVFRVKVRVVPHRPKGELEKSRRTASMGSMVEQLNWTVSSVLALWKSPQATTNYRLIFCATGTRMPFTVLLQLILAYNLPFSGYDSNDSAEFEYCFCIMALSLKTAFLREKLGIQNGTWAIFMEKPHLRAKLVHFNELHSQGNFTQLAHWAEVEEGFFFFAEHKSA